MISRRAGSIEIMRTAHRFVIFCNALRLNGSDSVALSAFMLEEDDDGCIGYIAKDSRSNIWNALHIYRVIKDVDIDIPNKRVRFKLRLPPYEADAFDRFELVDDDPDVVKAIGQELEEFRRGLGWKDF